MNIKHICDTLRNANKLVFIHIDMIEGLKYEYNSMWKAKRCSQQRKDNT
jgi:glycerol uptake operon antiterminator